MRHQQKKHRLGRRKAHRTALLRNLATALALHGRVRTTLAKAKAVRPFMEKLITKGKRSLVAKYDRLRFYRAIRGNMLDNFAAELVLKFWSQHFLSRPGGYTRIIKLVARRSDACAMAIIEMVDIESILAKRHEANGEKRRLKTRPQWAETILSEYSRITGSERLEVANLAPIPEFRFDVISDKRGKLVVDVSVSGEGFSGEEFASGTNSSSRLFPINLFLYAGPACEMKLLDKPPAHVHLHDGGTVAIAWSPTREDSSFRVEIQSLSIGAESPIFMRVLRENGATALKRNLQTVWPK
jgi:large subunit ribosomal protein L17